MIRIVVLAPIDNSLYARLVAFKLIQESDVQLAGIVVRSQWNLKRFLSEFERDGARLMQKVIDKWVKGDRRFVDISTENLAHLAERWRLPFKSLRKLAAEYNIPYQIVNDHNSPKSQAFIQSISPDLIVFTGGGLIKPNLLALPPLGILNCHSGILPAYRGMDVIEWTAAEGHMTDIGFGASLHLMDRGVDTGPILFVDRIALRKFKNFEEIRSSVEVKMVELMLKGVRAIRDHNAAPMAQKQDDGRQYYVMHPRMQEFAHQKLMRMSASFKS